MATTMIDRIIDFSVNNKFFVILLVAAACVAGWARSRTLEYLSALLPRLPEGVKTEIGPDATGLGRVFQYALVDQSGKYSLAEMRSYQDWFLRYHLKTVPGVAEVAPIGGASQNSIKSTWIPIDSRPSAFPSNGRWRPCAAATMMWAGAWSSLVERVIWCGAAATPAPSLPTLTTRAWLSERWSTHERHSH
jgi:hypothetical protein